MWPQTKIQCTDECEDVAVGPLVGPTLLLRTTHHVESTSMYLHCLDILLCICLHMYYLRSPFISFWTHQYITRAPLHFSTTSQRNSAFLNWLLGAIAVHNILHLSSLLSGESDLFLDPWTWSPPWIYLLTHDVWSPFTSKKTMAADATIPIIHRRSLSLIPHPNKQYLAVCKSLTQVSTKSMYFCGGAWSWGVRSRWCHRMDLVMHMMRFGGAGSPLGGGDLKGYLW